MIKAEEAITTIKDRNLGYKDRINTKWGNMKKEIPGWKEKAFILQMKSHLFNLHSQSNIGEASIAFLTLCNNLSIYIFFILSFPFSFPLLISPFTFIFYIVILLTRTCL